MIKVLVNGAKGRMGSLVALTVRGDSSLQLVGETDLGDDLRARILATQAEVAVDFTHPDAAAKNTEIILQAGAHPVVGTTGFKPEEIQRLQELAGRLGRGGVIAPNFAIGVILVMKFAAEAARYFPDVEIIEMHHNQKADAPSGTAIKTAEWIQAKRDRKPQGSSVHEKQTIPGVRGGRFRVVSRRLPPGSTEFSGRGMRSGRQARSSGGSSGSS